MEKQRLNRVLAEGIGSLFFIGKILPFFQGTVASIIGCIIYLFIVKNNLIFLLFIITLLIIGFPTSELAEHFSGKKDPKEIIIDDLSGMCISLLFIPQQLKYVFIGFVIFRMLDAFKIPPADYLEDFKGSIGIMGDDIIAGIYTNIILHIGIYLSKITL